MLKALFAVVCALALSVPVSATLAEDMTTFVIVPDNPGRGDEAVTTSALNVRAGPGTRYAVIDVLAQGEAVRVDVCEGGWCWINQRGPSGWVSGNYLRRTGDIDVDVDVDVIIVRPGRGACFYERPNFHGGGFCAVAGERDARLGSWNNRIRSIEVIGRHTVQLCAGRNFNDCDAFDRDVGRLPGWLDRNISSFRVFQ